MPGSSRVTSDPAARSRTVLDRYEGQGRVLAVIISTSSGPIHRSDVPQGRRSTQTQPRFGMAMSSRHDGSAQGA